MTATRRVVLAAPIVGAPTASDFRIEAHKLPELAEGEAIIRSLYVSADPGTRSRLSAGASYAMPLKAGDVIDGFVVGEVAESRSERLRPGDIVAMGGGWAEHQHWRGRGYLQKIDRRDVPLSAWIGILGIPGMTAWFGLKRVAGLRECDRVFVTSAAGPVGATAGQLARLLGAGRVGGSASASKHQWLLDEAGFDAVVDYRAPNFAAEVGAAMPEGIDVLFDNVGNASIDALIPLMRPGGRIVVSGQVADYNSAAGEVPGIRNTRHFISHRLRMEGLVVFDDMREFAEAQAQMADWIVGGALKLREVRAQGLESLPGAFAALFESGADFGRRIIDLTSKDQ
jgi:NADPH-dependent curcumin reductase CurA